MQKLGDFRSEKRMKKMDKRSFGTISNNKKSFECESEVLGTVTIQLHYKEWVKHQVLTTSNT
jgi:hypothetical protein